ncbi:MAG: hypothetical protein K2K24_04900, partial [Clostridia bacterium]|nr:hypothetical protein [Clostridia bacterium]
GLTITYIKLRHMRLAIRKNHKIKNVISAKFVRRKEKKYRKIASVLLAILIMSNFNIFLRKS